MASRRASALAYTAAQVVGACAGAVIANLMFELDPVTLSTHSPLIGWALARRGGRHVRIGDGDPRRRALGSSAAAPFAVAGYIAAAYWFTSSTSFANPAVTVGRTLTDTFAGIKPSSAPAFIAAQLLGGLAAVALARFLYPDLPASDVVMPHDHADV